MRTITSLLPLVHDVSSIPYPPSPTLYSSSSSARRSRNHQRFLSLLLTSALLALSVPLLLSNRVTKLSNLRRLQSLQGLRHNSQAARTMFFDGVERVRRYDWRRQMSFRVTAPMRVSILLSLILGVVLGIGVGVLSGLEPAVVIGVSASMALGCVFVMSFAIVHGVNVLRATAFAVFVSACLPLGFGVGFGVGILVAVFMGIEHPDDVRDKTSHFVNHWADFARVVLAFTMEIL